MKRFSFFAICMLASMLIEIRGDDEMPGYNSDYNASVRELLRSIVTNPEFLSLDLLKQQQILIRLYNIVERPDENWYRNLVDLINQNISTNNNNSNNSNRQQQKKHDDRSFRINISPKYQKSFDSILFLSNIFLYKVCFRFGFSSSSLPFHIKL